MQLPRVGTTAAAWRQSQLAWVDLPDELSHFDRISRLEGSHKQRRVQRPNDGVDRAATDDASIFPGADRGSGARLGSSKPLARQDESLSLSVARFAAAHTEIPADSLLRSGEFFGYYVIARQYYDRYGLPLMHTETNIREQDGAVQWLWKEWTTLLRLRQDGVPIVGFTWYSLTDQYDWDIALREERNQIFPVGLYDLERQPRKVGLAYRQLVEEWREFRPVGTSALMIV